MVGDRKFVVHDDFRSRWNRGAGNRHCCSHPSSSAAAATSTIFQEVAARLRNNKAKESDCSGTMTTYRLLSGCLDGETTVLLFLLGGFEIIAGGGGDW